VHRSVTVKVGGTPLQLKTDADARYLKQLAALVDEKLEQARAAGGKQAPTQKLALLAALSLADDLRQAQAAHRRLAREVRERGQKILARLDAEPSG
jgi:cell division protein ZapA (FtsZ GTPase activity inhibitor)